MERLAALAPQPHGVPVLGSFRSVRAVGGGRMLAVPRRDGLSVLIDTVSGASYGFCSASTVLPFAGPAMDGYGSLQGPRYRGEVDEAAGGPCTLNVTVGVDGRDANAFDEGAGCAARCGQRGTLDHAFTHDR